MFLDAEFGLLGVRSGSPGFAGGPAGPPERQGREERRGARARAGGHAGWWEARNRTGTRVPARDVMNDSASGQSLSPLAREFEGFKSMRHSSRACKTERVPVCSIRSAASQDVAFERNGRPFPLVK